MKKSEFLFALGRIINDSVMIFAGLVLAYFLRMRWFELLDLSAPTTLMPLDLFYIFALKITAVFIIVFAINGHYRFGANEKAWDEIWHLFWAFTAGMALIVIAFFFSKFIFFSRFIFGVAWLTGLFLVFGGRMGLRSLREKLCQWGYGKVKILVLGTGKVAKKALDYLSHSPQFEVVGILSEAQKGTKSFEGVPIIGAFDDFEKVLKEHKPDEVLVASEHSTEKITVKLVRIAHMHHTKFSYLPDELGMDLAAVEVSTLGSFPLITLQNTSLGGWGYVIKSFCDYIIASVSLVILSPLLGLIALKIRKENPDAPILYKSERIGRNGKPFECFKFRTMVPDAETKKEKLMDKNQRKGDVLFKLKDDPRITPIGKTLREWSLDELPNLINVIRGEMSLIGPRPHLKEEVKKYGQNNLRLLSIKPGVTGFAQINGRSSLSFEEEMNYEIFYLKNWTLWLDLIIFLKSIWVVLKREDAD